MQGDPHQHYLPGGFYESFLSKAAKARKLKPSPIRSLYPLEKPSVITLLAGRPNPETFPLKSVSFTARAPSDAPDITTEYHVPSVVLSEGLRSSPSAGIPSLNKWLTDFQEFAHRRTKNPGWRVSVGMGSLDLIYKSIHALVDDGDSVLVESPTYPVTLTVFEELHSRMIPVPTDSEGIIADELAAIMDNWPEDGPRKPRILYTVPYGGNPSGFTATKSRRLQVLSIARKHGIIILEDDPYYYLYFGPDPRPPSYFSLEAQDDNVSGLVLRFDSLSKIISSGIRIGFATGPGPLLHAIDLHTGISNLHASGLTQAIIYALVSSWGFDGFIQHTRLVSEFYRQKRDVFEAAMRTHMTGLADWVPPDAGLFFWFKLRICSSPHAEDGDSESLIRSKALEKGVLALPGTVFLPDRRKSAHVRAVFSLLGEDEVNEALRRLAALVREEREASKQLVELVV